VDKCKRLENIADREHFQAQMKTYWDKWRKAMNFGGETEATSFPEIEELIKRLDQSTYTQLILNGENNYLLIGGGRGQYIVSFVIAADDDFYTLLNDKQEDDGAEIDIVTGDQDALSPKI
jgi:hypothetical protein